MSLAARYLEENGIPTVIVAAARDIVETCGVPRLLFTDFPLGSPCGEPDNVPMQRQIIAMALDLLENAEAPRTTVQTPFEWSKGDAWKAKVFTQEQPWQTEEVKQAWLESKEQYRQMKKDGKV
ncbi:MAG: hypothetical protein QGF20_04625 [Alphaproteobacteria bacterium]|nr:hypothetical protein [Alphaproteobacteria bacterium]